jgi:putative glutamine amidotransferase
MNSSIPQKPNADTPRIGITTSPRRGDAYYDTYRRAVEAAGAVAVDLPAGTRVLPDVDGLLLPGGWDVDPELYGQPADPATGPIDRELDDTEMRLIKLAHDVRLPIMGICRGQQVINVALGGSLRQHIEGHEVRAYGRSHLAHTIDVEATSELGRAAGEHQIKVNSLHHQAVKELAPGLVQTARGDDGTVEAFESSDGLISAVQCHPEELTADAPWARNLFARFVNRARATMKAARP